MVENTKMSKIVLLLVIVIYVYKISGQNAGISSKLDFGSDDLTNIQHEASLSTGLIKALIHLQQPNAPSSSVISSKLDPKPFSIDAVAQIERKSQAKEGFSGLGVICVYGKCNSTSTSVEGKPSTDILVQVSTRSNENNGSNVPLSNSDVPVIIGNAGANKGSGNENEVNQRRGSTISLDTNKIDRHNHVVYPRVPHFQPSYNIHNFGEQPSPQYVWHRRMYQPAYNSYGFQVRNNDFKPVLTWRVRYPSVQYNPTSWMPQICTCNKPGLNWYPTTKPLGTTMKNPIISDKLDDL